MGLPLDFPLGSTDLVLRVVVKLMLVDLVLVDLVRRLDPRPLRPLDFVDLAWRQLRAIGLRRDA
jgi:hypothetical protein